MSTIENAKDHNIYIVKRTGTIICFLMFIYSTAAIQIFQMDSNCNCLFPPTVEVTPFLKHTKYPRRD